MAEGLISAAADNLLGTLTTTYRYVQLHTAAPGPAGTTAVAIETDRELVTWGAPSGGAIASAADLTWEAVAGSEDYTHFSVWDAVTLGNCGFTGAVTANAVTVGDNFVIPSGSLTASLAVAS